MKILGGEPHCFCPLGLISLFAPKSGKLFELLYRPQL